MEVLMLKDMVIILEQCTPVTMVIHYTEMGISHATTVYGKERYQSVNVSGRLIQPLV